MPFFKLYLIGLIIFLLIDLLWLGVIAKGLYEEQIGFLLADKFRIGPAALFYFLYMAGLVFFAILPAYNEVSWKAALIYGGFFGLVGYGTYDLTNLATLARWPVKIVVIDISWGTFLTGVTSLLTYLIGSYWKSS